MTNVDLLAVEVTAVRQVTPLIKLFTLRRVDGELMPPFSGGCHVTVIMNDMDRTHRNPYSLLGSPRCLETYQIAVRRDDQGRGGSKFMHQRVTAGTRLQISHPVNLFPLAKLARKHVLIAGGVGITPILAMIDDLSQGNVAWELHYAVRSPEHGYFGVRLKEDHGDRIHLYYDSAGLFVDFPALVAHQPLGTHLSICGPPGMIASGLEAAREAGWPESHLHFEEFSPPPTGEAFSVYLARSRQTVQVPPESSLLDAIEAAGVAAPYLCRRGACGRCEADVLELDGELIHNDHWLSPHDRQSRTKIMPCVSRAKGHRIVLDL